MSLFKNIVLFILSVQEKMLTRSLNNTLGIKNLSKSRKYYQEGCFLTLDSLAESEKNKIESLRLMAAYLAANLQRKPAA